MRIPSNPQQDNFYMPFEGEAHDATIIMLPYRSDTWANGGKKASKVFLEMVKAISKYEKVLLLVSSKVSYNIDDFKLPNVQIVNLEYDDSWARDNTLIFLTDGKIVRGVDFRFNAWGGKVDGLYSNWTDDDMVGERLSNYLNLNSYYLDDFILEGGSIHTNGNGTFITTEACLLSKGRNAKLSKQEIEETLKKYLNAKKIIWLPHGIYNDETNEHVDNMACFLDETKILLAYEEDSSDIQYSYSKMALDILENETTFDGKKIEVIKCPLPKTMFMTKEEALEIEETEYAIKRPENNRLAGSYINFYQSDKFVLLPKFNAKEDILALNILKNIYPNKDIIQIESREILLAGGNIHCTTMQIPKGGYKNED